MAFREVRVFEVREVLRLWLRGEGIRSTQRLAGLDRKTVRRYVAAAVGLGLIRDGGEEQLSDEFVGSVVEAVRPHRTDGHGEAWGLLVANHQLIEGWLKKDKVTVRKAHEFLGRHGIVVPERTMHRYALEVCKVHRDHHIEVAKALYSIPGNLIGHRVDVRADRSMVRIFARGQLVKVHPRQQPGGRSTDPNDLPTERTAYAMRDLEALKRLAAGHGPAVGAFAAALLDTPLPWTRMRQVYALLGLVKRWGAERVDAACAGALEHEAINVGLIGRMLERGTERTTTAQPALPGVIVPARFARDPEHFATRANGGAR